MAIDFFCPANVYGAKKIALKNPFISAEFDRILKHMESNWVLWDGKKISRVPWCYVKRTAIFQWLCGLKPLNDSNQLESSRFAGAS